jgi:carbon-monoxide dehydrogenase medium subunit
MDIAAVGVAAVVTLDDSGSVCRDVKIALGAVAPTPVRAGAAEEVLRGRAADQARIDEAARAAAAEARPIDDIRSSARHRVAIVEALTRRTLQYAISMARKTEIPFEVQRRLAVEAISS